MEVAERSEARFCQHGVSRDTYPLRLSLDDDDGVLRLRDLTIHNGPKCDKYLNILRKYLMNRPLVEIDIEMLRQDSRLAACPCVPVILKTIGDLQEVLSARFEKGLEQKAG